MQNCTYGTKPLEIAAYLRVCLPNLERAKIEAVIATYCEPWRTYHNLNRLWGMVKSAEQHFKSDCTVKEWQALLVSIIYSKAVYKVGGWLDDQERASADWASEDVHQAGGSEFLAGCVWAEIYATKTHTLDGVPAQYQKITSMLLDLNLESLGLPEKEFTQTTEAIWHEFQPIVDRQEYDRRRRIWAKGFLDRPQIFHTEKLRSLYEDQARSNLTQLWEA